jgi:hypothetical protein
MAISEDIVERDPRAATHREVGRGADRCSPRHRWRQGQATTVQRMLQRNDLSRVKDMDSPAPGHRTSPTSIARTRQAS